MVKQDLFWKIAGAKFELVYFVNKTKGENMVLSGFNHVQVIIE